MTTLSATSSLIDDVYLHHAVDGTGTLRVVSDPSGLVTVFTVGTDGNLRRLSPDAGSDTGWRLTDLAAPGHLDVLDVVAQGDGSTVVCGATSSTKAVHVLTIAADGTFGGWTTIDAGSSVADKVTFLDLVLRDTPTGPEFFLLYFQRMVDPAWRYTYRVGRAATTDSSWSIGFNLESSYTGSTPLVWPALVLREVDDKPTLSLYWSEAQTIRSWVGIDDTPVVRDISVPEGSDLRALVSPATITGNDLLAVGAVTEHPSGVFRIADDGTITSVAASLATIDEVAVTFDEVVGLDVMGRTAHDVLLHVHASPDLATWNDWRAIDDRVVGVTGVHDPDLGTTFFAATRDRTLIHIVRSPSDVDWEVDTLEVSTGTGSEVVWYTTKVAVLDAASRAVAGQPVTISCAETTEFLLGNRPDVVGPGRAVVVETSVVGNLVIRQSTAELGNLFVPQLELSLATGEEVTLTAHTDVQDELYTVTGDDLLAATGRDGTPLLPEDQRDNADAIAGQLGTCASLGKSPRDPAAMRAADDPSIPPPGVVLFTPRDGTQVDLGIDVGDFFEGIKNGIVGAFEAVVTAIGDDVVTGLTVAITTVEGAYEVFVSTMEHAFDAVRTVLEAIGAAFETALEWLGMLFDWAAISELADQVGEQMRSGLAGIPQVLAAAGLPGSIATTFDGLRESADGAFDYVRDQIGAASADGATTEAGFTNADDVFTIGGENVSNAANWLLDRLTDQIGEISSPFPIEGAGWSSVDDLWAAIGTEFLAMGQRIADNFIGLFEALATTDDVLGVLMGTIIDQMQSLVDGLLDVLQTIADGVVTALTSLAASDALLSVLTTPLDVPGISDLLAVVGLDGITLLDLISYLVAIPMHVVSSIVGVDDVLRFAETPVGIFLAAGIMFFVIMVFAAVNDALPEGKVVLAVLPALIWVALTAMIFYGVLAADEPPPELVIASLFYFGYQVVGLRTNALYFGQRSATTKFAIYSIVDAVFMNVLAAVWAIRMSQDSNPDKHPKGWQIAANHLGTLPDIFKWPDLVWPPPATRPVPVRVVVVGIDVIGMGALTAGAIADYIDNLDTLEIGGAPA